MDEVKRELLVTRMVVINVAHLPVSLYSEKYIERASRFEVEERGSGVELACSLYLRLDRGRGGICGVSVLTLAANAFASWTVTCDYAGVFPVNTE